MTTDPTVGGGLGRMIRDLDHRLTNLEAHNQLTRAQVDVDGATVFQIDGDGHGRPYSVNPWRPYPNVAVAITSGSYTTAWELEVPMITGPDVQFSFLCQTGTATTADVIVTGPGDNTDVVALSALSNLTLTCDFVHGLALGSVDQTFLIRARRTAGATNVDIFEPTAAALGKTGTATAGGLT